METKAFKERGVQALEVLVLGSGAVATVFGIAAAAHIALGAVQFALGLGA
ncbi:MAG: hypothetical protein ACM36B_18530 [Bacteroidota bacterium]|jgi:hypothetical protein